EDGSIFLEGVAVPPQVLEVDVDWANPDNNAGSVSFKVRGDTRNVQPTEEEPHLAKTSYLLHNSPFIPSLSPLVNRITVRAELDGIRSDPMHVGLMVIPVPRWAQFLGVFLHDATAASFGVLVYKLKTEFPEKPITI